MPWKQHKPKACFKNAQRTIVQAYPTTDLRYVEGYVSPETHIPILHAWLTINGKVIDTTLRPDPQNNTKRIYGIIPDKWEYYGVELPIQEILHVYERHRTHISIVDDFQCHWPAIRRRDTQAT